MTPSRADTILESLTVTLDPLGDRVVILPDAQEEVSAGGIFLPETEEQQARQTGVVVVMGRGGVGEHCPNPYDHLSAGDRVVCPRFGGEEMKLKTASGDEVTFMVFRLDAIITRCNAKA